MCFNMIQELRQCSKENQIPDQVLIDILSVYEFGKKEEIKELPNNLICQRNGDFWTTWDRVIEIRKKLKERHRNINEPYIK